MNYIFNERDFGLAHFFMHSTLVIFNPNNHNAIMNNFIFKLNVIIYAKRHFDV
jgi:hypothetical protein